MRHMKKLNNIKLVDIEFWDDTIYRTTFDRLQELLGIKDSLKYQVKNYTPVPSR